jgi:PHD/YefM family antitoxin component YafN of YafNO toxin-antitoxin module
MPVSQELKEKTVSPTDFRDHLSEYLESVRNHQMVVVESRHRDSKSVAVVDKEWLDAILSERKSILATIEILADRELTERLLRTANTIDEDIQSARLRTHEEVFG